VNFDKKARTNDEQWIKNGLILTVMEKGLIRAPPIMIPLPGATQ
jgi:hypothetical protein